MREHNRVSIGLSAALGEAWAAAVVLGARLPVAEVESLSAFKRHMWRRYEHAPHLDLLDQKLEAVTRYVETRGREGIGRLIISMPPRHGKTMTTSKLFPAWFLGRNPDKRVMLVSYGQSLANKNSRAARNFVGSPIFREVFPAVRLADDSAAVQEWDIAGTAGEGGVSALGIGGASTGKGAHVLIIDDPHKGRREAESVTMRDAVWAAFQGDLIDRLEPGAAIIIMATRWHEDDLTGRALREMGGEGWEVLNLKALAGDDDPLGRKPGAALWPGRYPRPVLLKRKQAAGEYEWASKYDGEPMPAEGGVIKEAWFKPWVTVKPPTDEVVRYWDLAMSEKQSADYTAGLRLERGLDGLWYVTGMARGQVDLSKLGAFIRDTIVSDGPGVRQGFERKGYMTKAVTDMLKDPTLRPYDVKGYEADADKFTRALPWVGRASLGMIRVVVGPEGLSRQEAEELVREFKSFPAGAHDDQVDAMSGAWVMINEEKPKPIRARSQSYVG